MPCGWGVKAGMVRVWVAGKTVRSPCYTRVISERFEVVEHDDKALYKYHILLLHTTYYYPLEAFGARRCWRLGPGRLRRLNSFLTPIITPLRGVHSIVTVSYTHLTLPTIYSV